jgi:hypothetical protein
VPRFMTHDRLYRKTFWGWFALTLVATVGCYGGNRALPEMVLAILLLLMGVVWSMRVARAGGPPAVGPRTAHLVRGRLTTWAAASFVPLRAGAAGGLCAWWAWGL